MATGGGTPFHLVLLIHLKVIPPKKSRQLITPPGARRVCNIQRLDDAEENMKDFSQDGARIAETARLIAETARLSAGNKCTLGEARTCAMSGNSKSCRGCGWLDSEVERRRKLPLHRNRDRRWQMKIGVRKS